MNRNLQRTAYGLVLFIALTTTWALESADMEKLLENAQQGDPEAQKELASLYVDEDIVDTPVNSLKVFRWAKRLADDGDSNMQKTVARMYLRGIGTEPDEGAFAEWIMRAAESGDSESQLILSFLHENGEFGIDKSLELAIVWSLKSAEQGNPRAQRRLGSLYSKTALDGDSLKHEEMSKKWNVKAYETFKTQAESGDVEAQYTLGDIYFYGIEGWMENFDRKKSFMWFLKAAEQGHGYAQVAVGTAYREGRADDVRGYGVEKDGEKAVEWYKKAAEQGIEEAKNLLKSTYSIEVPEK